MTTWPTKLTTATVGLTLAAAIAPQTLGQDQQESTTKLNVFAGQVVDQNATPVPEARVYAADASVGFIFYDSPTSVFAHGPTERFLLFFPKANGKGSEDATTDKHGNFKMIGLRAGSYDVLAVHPEKGITIVRDVDQPNEDEPRTIKLNAPTYVEASVKGLPKASELNWHLTYAEDHAPWSAPLGELFDRIIIRPSMMKTEDDNRMKSGPLPSGGKWQVRAEQIVTSRRMQATIISLPVNAKPGETTKLDIDLTTGSEFAGTVLGPDGKPLNEVAVRLKPAGDEDDPRPIYGAVTDEDGKYAIRGLSDGTYQLEARRWGKPPLFG